jgi:hypothetical protein
MERPARGGGRAVEGRETSGGNPPHPEWDLIVERASQRARIPPDCPRTRPQVFAPCLLGLETASSTIPPEQLQSVTNKQFIGSRTPISQPPDTLESQKLLQRCNVFCES